MLTDTDLSSWLNSLAMNRKLTFKIARLIQLRYFKEYCSFVRDIGADDIWDNGKGVSINNRVLDIFYMPVYKTILVNGEKAATGMVLIIANNEREESALLFGVDMAAFANVMSSKIETTTLRDLIDVSNKCITNLDYKDDGSGQLIENMMIFR